jgi:sugar/nucleoside kinase (ribokinase family)
MGISWGKKENCGASCVMENGSRFNTIIGTGGIGVGMLFLSDKMEILGRNESRPVILSRAKDYCKLHIVFYYVSTLTQKHANVFPIGFVGDDISGHNLLAEMDREGMDVKYVGVSAGQATMVSICLQYPDKEGCNFTAMNNATVYVTPEYVQKCMGELNIDKRTIVVALPEVSVESRIAILRLGKANHAFTVLAITAAEVREFLKENVFIVSDLLAVNEGEGQAVLGRTLEGKALISQLHSFLSGLNPNIQILVTCGSKGAWTATKDGIEYIPPLKATVINTAGAGDAFLGGTLAGLTRGLPLQKHRNDNFFGETSLESAAELGALCAGMSVETEDSIAFHVTLENIKKRIVDNYWVMEPGFIY